MMTNASRHLEEQLATFGGGCFWCLEAVFERIPGVRSVTPGYMGGWKENPSYAEVCTGKTGHAEVVQLVFDPGEVRYEQLLDWFWRAHDPTQVDGQGPDIGPQYRSVIFYHTETQKILAEASKSALVSRGRYRRPIVTAIQPAGLFWPAEEYHRAYYRRNPDALYCRMVIRPKLEKLALPV